MNAAIELSRHIRDIPDYPVPGVNFKDICPLLQNASALKLAVSSLVEIVESLEIDVVAAPDARGFIFGVPVAMALNCGFVPIRKAGKLPYEVNSLEYELEYGTDTLEIHVDAVEKGTRVLLVDDLLATGGTIKACCELLEQQEAIVASCCFVVELDFLNARERLAPRDVQSIIHY
ncbi:MAG: adenine phosphoribosyltransferase [Pirellulaceae bacterium]|nr:adenine phosphoribosyltransferase [Pirellulaceae bacterium]